MGAQSSTDKSDYAAVGFSQYCKKLRKHVLKRDEVNTTNFVFGYFRMLEQETNCRIVGGIQHIIASYCSFDMNITLNIWDTAGQERFHALAPLYYRDSDAAILVYDITDSNSFSKLIGWFNELTKICGKNIAIVIACNKIDLESHTQVTHSDAESFAVDINAQLIQVSALAGIGIDQLFDIIGLNALNNRTVNNNNDFKIIMLGEGFVGKTSIMHRYVRGVFPSAAGSTFTGSYMSKNITVACSLKRYIRSITFDKEKVMLNLLQQKKQKQQKEEIKVDANATSVLNTMSIGNYVYNQYQDLKKEWFG
eukprot:451479_1